MVKKKDREKKPADLTPEERQQMADVLTRKIAALMSDFLKKNRVHRFRDHHYEPRHAGCQRSGVRDPDGESSLRGP